MEVEIGDLPDTRSLPSPVQRADDQLRTPASRRNPTSMGHDDHGDGSTRYLLLWRRGSQTLVTAGVLTNAASRRGPATNGHPLPDPGNGYPAGIAGC